MKLEPFTKPGSTPSRRRFWDAARLAVLSARKLQGHNITVEEHEGAGTIINALWDRGRFGGPGACCYDDGSCADLSAADCNASGGTWQGSDTNCAGFDCGVACCYEDAVGTCIEQTRQDCLDAGGLPQDFGTTCDPNPCPLPEGACCNLDGSCSENVTDPDCDGAWQGAGTHCIDIDCTHTGACCDGGTCSTQRQVDCTGIYMGDGTPCVPNPCILPPCDCSTFPAFDGSGRRFRSQTVTVSGTQVTDGHTGITAQSWSWNATNVSDCYGSCVCSGTGNCDSPAFPAGCTFEAVSCVPSCPDGLCRWPDGTSNCGWAATSGDCVGPFGISNMAACCTGTILTCCGTEIIVSAEQKQITYSCGDEVPCFAVNATTTITLSDECI